MVSRRETNEIDEVKCTLIELHFMTSPFHENGSMEWSMNEVVNSFIVLHGVALRLTERNAPDSFTIHY